MIVKGHEGHVISVSTVFKVHYNQKLGDQLGHLGGGRTMAFGGIDAPAVWRSLGGGAPICPLPVATPL